MSEIFNNDHEANDWSEWDTAGAGKFSISSSAGLNSTTYGILYDRSGGAPTYPTMDMATQGLSAASGIYYLSFYINTNTLAISAAGLIAFFFLDDFFGNELVYCFLSDDTEDLLLECYEDSGSHSDISTTLGSGEYRIQIVIERASSAVASDGKVTLYKGGVQVAQATSLDNYDRFGDFADGTLFISDGTVGTVTGIYYVDEIAFRDDSSPVDPNAFRFLGFDADDGRMYVSGLKNAGTLQAYDYRLSNLAEEGTASFGAATDSDLDSRVYGIFPRSKSNESGAWYMYGRDGNDLQVQYNDRTGTLGWQDIGPGTATWGTAKYAVALMVDALYSDDVIVVFSDDDIYRTRYGTMTWTKMGDAGGGLRASTWSGPSRSNEVLVAGTAAGTLEWSNNFGVSFSDVSGTALGTINAIEVSL